MPERGSRRVPPKLFVMASQQDGDKEEISSCIYTSLCMNLSTRICHYHQKQRKGKNLSGL